MWHLGWRYNRAKLSISWPNMIVSVIWNSSEIFASHLSRATAIFGVDCCQFSPSWIFGLTTELIILCRLGWQYLRAKLYFYWPYMMVLIIWNNSKLSASHLSRATAIFVVDCCQFGPSCILGLKWSLWNVPTWLAVQWSIAIFIMT